MEPLKNVYNQTFFKSFLKALKTIIPELKESDFLNDIFSSEWENMELKTRMHHIAKTLHSYLDIDFMTALEQIKSVVPVLVENNISGGFEYLFLPDYVEIYGQKHLKESVLSFETITTFVSCEFAIRPFIMEHSDYVMNKMKEWSSHSNFHIRRLSSEGCRPRLPWGMALTDFKKDPSAVMPILENLLNDDELYVRKSVANNLNDIAKDHPDTLIKFTKTHINKTKHTDWILKHANRTLLKQSEPQTMRAFGFGNTTEIDISNFKISTTKIQLGNDLFFSFDLKNNSKTETLIRLEYAVYYLKNNGSLSKKVFQISEKKYPPLFDQEIHKKQHFKPISTRRYHFGEHKIAVIANGKEFELLTFDLYE